MMQPYLLCRLVFFALVVLLLSACSDSAEEAADTTLAPTTTEAATTTTTAPTTTVAPTTTGIHGTPELLGNGDFETGDLTEWTTKSYARGYGGWFVYEDGTTPPTDTPRLYDHNTFEVSDPPQGQYAAVTDGTSEGLYILYQDFTVTGPSELHATVFYLNRFAPGYGYGETRIIAPNDLSTEPPNQQFRVDLIDPGAPIVSVADEDVLATVFRTIEGDPITLEPTEVTFDLSPWDGQTIRLRFAEVDNRGPLFAGVDDVRIEPSD
jgi:hypothetical protein